MIGTLLAHTGATRITRQALRAIEAPPATPTWRPVQHADLIDTLAQELDRRSLAIRDEAYAIQRDGAILFGVIDLAWRQTNEFAAAIGLRTANDKSMSLQLAIGLRIFVCDNLVFAGDLIALRRRHTARLDLGHEIARALDRYHEGVLQLESGVDRLRDSPLDDRTAKEHIFDVFSQEVMPIRFFRPVSQAYFSPDATAPELVPRTLWSLHNAFTREVRHMPPAPAFQATTTLGKMFGLGH